MSRFAQNLDNKVQFRVVIRACIEGLRALHSKCQVLTQSLQEANPSFQLEKVIGQTRRAKETIIFIRGKSRFQTHVIYTKSESSLLLSGSI